MKRLIIMLCIFTGVLGAGCVDSQSPADLQLKTYSNQTYGYEISYDPDVMDMTDNTLEGGTAGSPGFKFNDGGHVAVGVWENPESLSPKAWLDNKYAEYSGAWMGDFAETIINNKQAFSATKSDDCYINWIIAPRQSDFVTLRAEYCGADKYNFQTHYNEMVQSLSFN